jgi:alanine racemase/UDP-N-acetylmuramoyl-tripeptide--D-alanyl-D-alanine ligase
MGRLGVKPEQALKLARRIAAMGNLRLVGLMTHFASAENPEEDDFTLQQIARFVEVKELLRKAGFSDLLCHASATAGAARFPQAAFDMIRVGLGLYGIYPSAAVAEAIDLDLAVALVSRVIEVKEYSRGERIGYGGTFKVPYDGFRVGVVPIGYHDGIPLNFSNRSKVLVNGKEVGIIGRVSMDSMAIDLSEQLLIENGANVLIYGKYGGDELRPEDVAGNSDTIPYELLARVGPRVQRIFIESRY